MLDILIRGLAAYSLLGAAFALPFLWRGADRIDPAARGGSTGFRLLILPGVVALWPFLLMRWAGAGKGPS